MLRERNQVYYNVEITLNLILIGRPLYYTPSQYTSCLRVIAQGYPNKMKHKGSFVAVSKEGYISIEY